MKLITLNIWGGHIYEPLKKFIESYSEVEIFCLQEVYYEAKNKISSDDRLVHLNIFQEIQDLLPNHRGLFHPTVNETYGLAIFISKQLHLINSGDLLIHENPDYLGFGPDHSRILQWCEFLAGEKQYTVVNIHGLWNGRGKTDTPERLLQSKNIRNYMDHVHMPYIVCGDFNLRPDTESLRIISDGMQNLIQEHHITSTRTSYYLKPEKFADYIFVSPEIRVEKFLVLEEEVSDHAALLLEFK